MEENKKFPVSFSREFHLCLESLKTVVFEGNNKRFPLLLIRQSKLF